MNIDSNPLIYVEQQSASTSVAMVSFNKSITNITKTCVPVTSSFGEIMQYTITAVIADQSNYQSMVISDTLPTGVEYVASSESHNFLDAAISFSSIGKNLSWTVADFISSGMGTITLTYQARVWKEDNTVAAGSTLSNTAKMNFEIKNADSSISTFPNILPALQATTAFTVKEPSITLSSKTSIPATNSSVTAGAIINHSLTVINGNGVNVSAGYEVKASETLPMG